MMWSARTVQLIKILGCWLQTWSEHFGGEETLLPRESQSVFLWLSYL